MVRFYKLCLSFRPEEELYDIKNDPDCIHNLADNPRYRETKETLAAKLHKKLVEQEDPRALGNGAIFDTYYYMGFPAMKKMYGDRFKVPEHLKQYELVSNGKVD